MELFERANQELRATEDETIVALNSTLDASFNRLVRRARIHMRAGYSDPAQRNVALLQEFRRLIPRPLRPEAVDAYDRALRSLIEEAQRLGLLHTAAATDRALPTRNRVDVSIPLEAVLAALQQAKGYLARHGEQFARVAAEIIARAIAEGRPLPATISDLRARLDVVKSRAEAIVRTESLRAYNTAADRYYLARGIDLVLYYATADDRSCAFCAPRAGQVYKRGAIQVPLHPRCRCYLAPWSLDTAELNPQYAALREQHRKEVAAAARFPNADILNKRGVFETLTPIPLSV